MATRPASSRVGGACMPAIEVDCTRLACVACCSLVAQHGPEQRPHLHHHALHMSNKLVMSFLRLVQATPPSAHAACEAG